MGILAKTVIAVLVILFFGLFILYFSSDKIKNSVDQEISGYVQSKFSENLTDTSEESLNVNSSQNPAGDFGESSSAETAEPPNPKENMTLEPGECGYYFENYGVCSGRCPSGACVSEKRSCYCRES
jgi:hypothetical protein